MLALWKDPAFREKMAEVQRNRSIAHREASAERMRERWKDPEWRAMHSKRIHKLLEDPEFRAKFFPQKGSKKRPERVKGVCVYCGGPATCRDHDIPTSRGGTDDPSNIVLACRKCNASKGRLTGKEFRQERERLGL